MSDTLKPGLTATCHIDVDTARTIGFMGEELRVYSTPSLLYDVEVACRDLILPHIGEGKDSVGTRVELDHVGATLLGMWVEITVTLAEVNGPAVTISRGANNGDSLDSIRCVFMSAGLLSGFTLTNGHAPYLSLTNDADITGGGVFAEGGTLSNCTLTGNSSDISGGGAAHGTLYNLSLIHISEPTRPY